MSQTPEIGVGGIAAVRLAVGEALRLPERLLVSEWADKHRVLDSKTSAEAGGWRTDRTPYLREVMDSFCDPETERISLMFCTQVGKTEGLLNMMDFAVDQDPGPAIYVMPTEDLVKRFSKQRLKPMFEACPTLSARLGSDAHDQTKFEYSFDRMTLFLAWSNSPATLSSFPLRYVFMDEVDKYPAWAGKEASPVKLATERTKTFWNKRIVLCSTPTNEYGYIYQSFQESDRCEYMVPCPHCGKYQQFVMSGVKWPEGERDHKKIREHRLAWYECIDCGKRIEDDDKEGMLLKGVWCPAGGEVNNKGLIGVWERPSKIHRGFHLNAIYSPWLTFSDMAAEFLESKSSPEKMMNFVNSWLAEVWRETVTEVREDKLRRLELDYAAGTVPDGVLVLTGTADVQKDHVHYCIRGWGYGEESWLIERGTLREFDEHGEMTGEWKQLTECVLERTFLKVDGSALRARLLLVDSAYRADEVYAYCRTDMGRIRAIRGSSGELPVPWRALKVERNPVDGRVPDGHYVQLRWDLDTYFFKDKLARLLNAQEARWHLHRETPGEHLREICAEHKVLKRNKTTGCVTKIWVKRPGGGENHGLDLEVYQLAAADMLQVYRMVPDGEAKPEERVGIVGRVGMLNVGRGRR